MEDNPDHFFKDTAFLREFLAFIPHEAISEEGSDAEDEEEIEEI